MSYKLIVAFFFCSVCYSQSDQGNGLLADKTKRKDFFLSFGQNFTTYLYQNSSNQNPTDLKKGNGLSLEVGKRFKTVTILGVTSNFTSWISLNQYNSLGGDSENNYTWDTNYLGLNFDLQKEVDLSGIEFFFSLGAGVNKIIFGTQTINGETFDLVDSEEFNNFFLRPFIEIGPKLNGQTSDIAFLLGISKDYAIQRKSNEQLNFSTIQLKIRLWIK